MIEPIDELFQYHTWATLQLIDHCSSLTPEQLDYTIPGTMGTIQETIAHLVRSDAWYLWLMTHDENVEISNSLPLSDLRARFIELSEDWKRVLARLDDYDPTLPEDDESVEVPHARNLLLAQAIHHGNDHRTHVWSILGAKGLEVPENDVWAYWYRTKLATPAD
jgi:uncharacterized damage-inducible protein DinB